MMTSRSNLDALFAAPLGEAGADWFAAIVAGEDIWRKNCG
jgi:hypothetical protein